MASPPTFQRAPRLYPEVPGGEVEIPSPPPKPAAPSASLLTLLLPGTIAIVTLVVTALTAVRGNLVLTIVAMVFSGVTTVNAFLNYRTQRNRHRRTLRDREQKYGALLAVRRQELSDLRDRQQEALLQVDPSPQECVNRVASRNRHLWERSPQDVDFLEVRLGLGERPFGATVKAPKQSPSLDPDPLVQAAESLAAQFAKVQGVPTAIPLLKAGAVGLAGPRGCVLNAARALAVQVAAHHSPDDVKIVAIYPPAESSDWAWLRWLPHVWSDDGRHRFLAQDRKAAHHLMMDLRDALNLREQQARQNRDRAALSLPCYVLLLAAPQLVEGEPILPLLLGSNPNLGAVPVFLVDRVEDLPRGCRAIADLASGEPRLVFTAAATVSVPYQPDLVPADLAEGLSRAMAPIRLQRIAGPQDIPETVSLLESLGVERAEDLDILARWRASEPYRSMAAPIGRRVGAEPLLLDLHERAHGPHGLVAGTTGSGKSELVQTLVASLATHFHPHEVAFVLADYKGGGTASAFKNLPHLLGTITNLQGGLAVRALSALRGELERRQRLLAQVAVGHIDDYQRLYRQGRADQPLPRLVLVVDEFAEMKAAEPDFVRELISVARVGRSLGVHLILVMQNPSGVVDDQIWANARFRLCLRVEGPHNSLEVLRRDDAARLAIRGRGYFQVGNDEIFELFQAGWAGAPYLAARTVDGDQEEIAEVALDGSRQPLGTPLRREAPQSAVRQLEALVAHLAAVAEREGIPRLPAPWLESLPNRVTLEEVRGLVSPPEGWDGEKWEPARNWLEPIVGLADDPVHQFRGPLSVAIGREGNVAVYGAPGAGKTTFLQTMVTSLVLSHSPRDVQLYLVDFGSRLLTIFAPLPHVGGVVLPEEEERFTRLLSYLLREIEQRKESFARAGVSTLPAYREAVGELLPALVVVLDNYAGLAGSYPDAQDLLAQLAREGGNLGVHLVLTANSPSAVRYSVAGSITFGVALQLADRGEYRTVVGPTEGLEPGRVPGRGLVRGSPPLEFQTALPAGGDSEADRAAALKALIARIGQSWSGPRAQPIPMVPEVLPLSDLLPPGDAWPPPPDDGSLSVPVGLDVDSLEPFQVDLNQGPHFLVAGPGESGKTTLLRAWLLALADRFSPQRLQLFLVDSPQAGLLPLARLPHVRGYLVDDDGLGNALSEIARELRERREALDEARRGSSGLAEEPVWLAIRPALVMVVDDFDALLKGTQLGTRERLEQVVRREKGLGFHLLLSGSSSDLAGSWEGLAKALRDQQTGFLLGSSELSELQLLNIRLAVGENGKPLPPGQGFFARRGRSRKVKVATPHAGPVTLSGWIDALVRRAGRTGHSSTDD